MNSIELIINSPKFGKHCVLIDAGGSKKIMGIAWNLAKCGRGYCVKGWDNSCKPRQNVKLCRLITNASDGERVYFRDGNNLNCTKSNLILRPNQEFIELSECYKLKIYSKNEENEVFFDKEDLRLVKDKIWRIVKNKTKKYAATGVHAYVAMHALIMGDGPDLLIDHRDGDSLNNRKSNLRSATQLQNSYNSRKRTTNTTGFKGVFFVKDRGRYWAYITANKKRYSGGFFKTPIEAARKYNELATKYHGDFAKLNLIPDEHSN